MTFEQIVISEFGGCVERAAQKMSVSAQNLHHLLHGGEARSSARGVIGRVAMEVGECTRSLFPRALYPRAVFRNLCDTPGYRLLQERHALSPGSSAAQKGSYAPKPKGPTLLDLFRDNAFSRTDYRRFCNLLKGRLSIGQAEEFILRVARKFGVSPEDIFPPSMYVSDTRVPFAWRSQYIDDAESAQETLHAASYCVEEVLLDDLRKNVRELLAILSPREKRAVVESFGLDGKGERVLEKIAPHIHVGTRERVRQIKGEALKKMRKAIEVDPDRFAVFFHAHANDGDRVVL